MLSQNELRATKLGNLLSGFHIHLSHAQCVDVISQLSPNANWQAQSAGTHENHLLAEQYLDELIEALLEVNYSKFVRRFEEKYLVNMPESEFNRDIRNTKEDNGNYIGREYMGCLSGEKIPGDDRYPDHIRYIWRCFFEKNEMLIRVGIYKKDGTYYVSNAGSL